MRLLFLVPLVTSSLACRPTSDSGSSGAPTETVAATDSVTDTATDTATDTTSGKIDVKTDTDTTTVVDTSTKTESKLIDPYTDDEKNSILYNGSLLIALPPDAALRLTDEAPIPKYVVISAPLVSNTLYLYNHEDANYPATPADVQTVATDGHYVFDEVRDTCQAADDFKDRIKLKTDTYTPTKDERKETYKAISECLYQEFTSKPYYLPQLVDDVDLCTLKLGARWRMPKEEDLAAFSEDVYEKLHEVLGSAIDAGDHFATHQFSLAVYVRATDGSLKVGLLYPGLTTSRIVPLQSGNPKTHFESQTVDGGVEGANVMATVVVRCLGEP